MTKTKTASTIKTAFGYTGPRRKPENFKAIKRLVEKSIADEVASEDDIKITLKRMKKSEFANQWDFNAYLTRRGKQKTCRHFQSKTSQRRIP